MPFIAPVETILATKKVALFDLDGTLIDSLRVWPQVDLALWETLTDKPAPSFQAEHQAHFASRPDGNPWVAWCARLARLAGSQDDPHVLHQRRFEISRHKLKHEVRVLPGVLPLLTALRARGTRLGLVTNTRGLNVELYRHQNPQTATLPWDAFEVIISADEGLSPKPSPEPYLEALARMKVPAHEAVVFEDAAEGVLAAHEAGLTSIAIAHATHPHEHPGLWAHASWVTPHWGALFS